MEFIPELVTPELLIVEKVGVYSVLTLEKRMVLSELSDDTPLSVSVLDEIESEEMLDSLLSLES